MDMRFLLQLLHTLKAYREREHWTRQQLASYQAASLRALRDHAYAHSPFYQQFHHGLTDRPLSELPVLTKSMLMEHFDSLVTDRAVHLEAVREHMAHASAARLFLGRYHVAVTPGSSGHSGLFLFSPPEWLTVMASFARGQGWADAWVSPLRRQRVAVVASVNPWHLSAQVGAAARTWWTPALRLPASDPLETVVRQLNDWRPDRLIAYASMLRVLADEQRVGRLRISPQHVFATSEVLTGETRRRILQAWGATPYNQYAATGTACLAAERAGCRRMHVFEDLLLIEVVDRHYHPVPPGTYGTKLLVTVLFSRTQPLIRYELDDSVRLSPDPCSCGLPFAVLDSIQGRVEDALWLPAPDGGRVTVAPLAFGEVLDALPVSGWQLVHQPDDSLIVLLSGARNELSGSGSTYEGPVRDALKDALRKQLTQVLADHGASVPHIAVQWVDSIPQTSAGKTLPVVTRWPPGQ